MVARKQTAIKVDPKAGEEAKIIFKEYKIKVAIMIASKLSR